MSKFIEVTDLGYGRKVLINTSHIVRVERFASGRVDDGILVNTIIDTVGPEPFVRVEESLEQIKAMLLGEQS